MTPMSFPTAFRDDPLTRHATWGAAVVGVTFAGALAWAAIAQLSGAVLAHGLIVVDTNVKVLQHREGGAVAGILVRNGDKVSKGQTLIRLEDPALHARLRAIDAQISQLDATRERMQRERGVPVTPHPLPEGTNLARGGALEIEAQVKNAETDARRQRRAQLEEQVRQIENEISGLQAQKASLDAQYRIASHEHDVMRRLFEQGYTTTTRVSALEREAERLSGARGEITAAIAKARARISEVRVVLLREEAEDGARAFTDLRTLAVEHAKLQETRDIVAEQIQRLELKAPSAGRVHQLSVHTIGGVAPAGEPLLAIVPDHEPLLIEARIDPRAVDQIGIGDNATVRLTALSPRSTPPLAGRIETVSPTSQVDQGTGQHYFVARLRILKTSMPDRVRAQLVPGMPVEIAIETAKHSALEYLMKPISDQIFRTFREE